MKIEVDEHFWDDVPSSKSGYSPASFDLDRVSLTANFVPCADHRLEPTAPALDRHEPLTFLHDGSVDENDTYWQNRFRMGGCKLPNAAIRHIVSLGTRKRGAAGKVMTSTDFEVLLFLYKVCDGAGAVENLTMREIAGHMNCSLRSIYDAIKHLEKLGFLSRRPGTYAGQYSLVLRHARYAFSEKKFRRKDKKKDKHTYGYVSLADDAFDFGTAAYSIYDGLSVGCKVFYLFCKERLKFNGTLLLSSIAKEFGCSKRTIIRYVDALNRSLLLHLQLNPGQELKNPPADTAAKESASAEAEPAITPVTTFIKKKKFRRARIFTRLGRYKNTSLAEDKHTRMSDRSCNLIGRKLQELSKKGGFYLDTTLASSMDSIRILVVAIINAYADASVFLIWRLIDYFVARAGCFSRAAFGNVVYTLNHMRPAAD